MTRIELENLLSVYRSLPESFDGWPQHVNDQAHHGDYPINVAAQRCFTHEVDLLLANGASINQGGEHGYRPLHNAIERGGIQMVKHLMCNGADLHLETSDGVLPLDLAWALEENEIAEILQSWQ